MSFTPATKLLFLEYSCPATVQEVNQFFLEYELLSPHACRALGRLVFALPSMQL
jgi:hypothetical protein